MKTKLLSLAALLCVLGGGCVHRAKSPSGETALVDWYPRVVESILPGIRKAELLRLDEAYVSLTDRQIDAMMAYVERHRHRGRYMRELWDCDEVAREYRVLASEWTVQVLKDPPAGLAFATLFVEISGNVEGLGDYGLGGLHVMVAVRRTDGVWFLIEPAKGKRVPLLGPLFEGTLEIENIHL